MTKKASRMSAALAICLAMLLGGCGEAPEQTTGLFPESEETAITKACQEAAAVAEDVGFNPDEMEQVKERSVKAMIFNGESVYTDQALLVKEDGSADSVGIFYVDDMDTALADIKAYLSDLEEQVNVYSASERFKISHAVVDHNSSDMICLIICEDVESAKKTAAEVVEE